MSVIEENPTAAYMLKTYQEQLDPDGVNVGVSRQALDEVLEQLEQRDNTIVELKANHADLVMRNAALRDRPDIPTERVKSVIALSDRVDELKGALNSSLDILDKYASNNPVNCSEYSQFRKYKRELANKT